MKFVHGYIETGEQGMDSEQVDEQISHREERRETSWIAIIRLPDGTEITIAVKDVSPPGQG